MTNSTSKTTVPLSRFTKYGLAIAAIAASALLGFATLAQTPAPAAAPKSSSQGSTTATKKPATAGTATHPATYDRALLHPALLKDKAPDVYVVKFVTTRGDFTVTVTRAWAPLGADRFYNLVKHHFYDNAVVFRAVPNFVTQFGISSYPAVSTAWKKTEIKDDPVTQSNKKGAIVFATAGPNTRTTQVFINLKDNAFLDKTGFAPFGTVDAGGMNIVEMFYDQYGDSAGIDQDQIEKTGKPYLDKSFPKLDVIKSATIISPVPTVTPAAKPKPTTTAKPASSTPKPSSSPNR
ncbi:MAG TPA: peptidylprolyl isomerase [Candidatus Acidoferrum sp.]|jgi:peptidyl-prolyl cis-trans isomerase A (cyclophilin A)